MEMLLPSAPSWVLLVGLDELSATWQRRDLDAYLLAVARLHGRTRLREGREP